MPAEVVTLLWCADYDAIFEVPSSDGSKTYRVQFSPSGGAYCTCPGFMYRDKCKHIEHVFEEACLWNPQWYDGGARTVRPSYRGVHNVPHETCPKCHGPMIAVRCAV